MAAWSEDVLIRLTDPGCAHRITGAERLGHGDAVRNESFRAGNALENPLIALPPAGPEVAALHAVPEEEQIVLFW